MNKIKDMLLSEEAELRRLGIKIANGLPKNDRCKIYEDIRKTKGPAPVKFKKNKFRK